MMQILNKVFMEKGDRLLFWNKIRRFPILLVNRKERATVPSMEKGAEKKGQAPFPPVLPHVYRLLDLTKIRG